LNLLIQVAMGMVLIAGAFLARRKHYRGHGACQSAVLVLNLALIFSVMWPSFHSQVLPGLRKHLGKRYYAVATIHGVAGAVAEAIAAPAEAQWVERHLRPLAGLAAEAELGGERRSEAFAAWRRFFEALAEQHPLGLGLDTGAGGALRQASGRLSPELFTLGWMRRGELWESVAIPEIRAQAAALADWLRW